MLVKNHLKIKETTSLEKPGFYQRLIYKQLSRMNLGRLNLILPDGSNIHFGNGIEHVSATVTVNDLNFFKKIVLFGDIGFGESYVDGLWDTDNITEVISWVLLNIETAPSVSGSKSQTFATNILRFFNKFSQNNRENTLTGSRKNISEHYDLNNDFFATFLDRTMTYSAAYFSNENMDLEEAQIEKYDRLCRKLHLKHTDHVLEIGSGWGGNAIHMAQNYGCKVTSLTLSVEQQKFATERIKEAGLSHKIEVLVQDYRTVSGTFDKIVSIEMLEAVGHQYLEPTLKNVVSYLRKTVFWPFRLLSVRTLDLTASKKASIGSKNIFFPAHFFHPSAQLIQPSIIPEI